MQTCLKSSWSQFVLCIRFSTYLHFREFIVLSSGSASNSDESSSTREVSAIWYAATFLPFHLIINTDLSFIFSALLSQSFFRKPTEKKCARRKKRGRVRGGEEEKEEGEVQGGGWKKTEVIPGGEGVVDRRQGRERGCRTGGNGKHLSISVHKLLLHLQWS